MYRVNVECPFCGNNKTYKSGYESSSFGEDAVICKKCSSWWEDFSNEDDYYDGEDECPFCGSDNFDDNGDYMSCEDCGSNWCENSSWI